MGKVIETVTDSIAIEILDKNAVLTGKGNELHLYTKNGPTENVFESQVLDIKLTDKVHGIKRTYIKNDKNILLVYGGKQFVLAAFNNLYKFEEFYRTNLSDWISCGCFINDGDEDEIVLLTAHSIILRFTFNAASKECVLTERVSCTDKSTLYCAHMCGSTWKNLVVFSGNAFGELLIWQPAHNKEVENILRPKESFLIHRTAAHNGVIFSIDYDEVSRCLITTSDDRAIKWWRVNFIGESKEEWRKTELLAMSSGYGHVARVFQGRIIKDGDHIFALSVGEDSYFCLWHRNGELLFKRRQQFGATIWNVAYDCKTKTIYTVGSVGNLIAFDLKQVLRKAQQQNQNECLLKVLGEGKHLAEYIAKVKFLNEHLLIGITNQNCLKFSKYQDDIWHEWQSIDNVKLDFKCTVMEVYENHIALSGYKRLILLEYLADQEKYVVVCNKELLKSIIRCVVFFSKQHYLVCDDQGNCEIFMKTVNVKKTLKLPICKEPWLTSALLLNQQEYLVISNRQGNLLLYQLNASSNSYEIKQTIKHPHGNLGATYIDCLEETLASSALIRSTGHDGALNFYSIDYKESTITACQRQIIPVSWVEHIEKCLNLNLYLGFNDNHFVVWSKEYDFLLQLPCGGGHRCWHFVLNSENNHISLVFIKNKGVRYHKIPLLNKKLTLSPSIKRWHISPCNIMQILPAADDGKSTIVVTAGDDNLVKIHTYTKNGLKEQQELHNHISNIRALKVTRLNNQEFLIFSGGGRAQLCVTRVNNLNFHINELINYTLKPISEHNITTNTTKTYNFDPETRIMSLDTKQINEHKYNVYVGCSDGFVRLLHLDLVALQVNVIKQHFYNKCVLQVRCITELDYVLVGATDGYLQIFDGQLSDCVYQLPHHSSGINSLDYLYNKKNQCLSILSGGDDQAVTYSELSTANAELKILKQFHEPFLHTAQVCACALSSNGLYGFTSGVDQILNKIDLLTGKVVDSFYSCVADIKGVALADDDTCLLYGCGLQIYAFKS